MSHSYVHIRIEVWTFRTVSGGKQELHLCAEISAAKSLDRVGMGGELSLDEDDATFLDMLRGLWLFICCYHYFSLI